MGYIFILYYIRLYIYMCVCVRVCARACVCTRACVLVCVCARVCKRQISTNASTLNVQHVIAVMHFNLHDLLLVHTGNQQYVTLQNIMQCACKFWGCAGVDKYHLLRCE